MSKQLQNYPPLFNGDIKTTKYRHHITIPLYVEELLQKEVDASLRYTNVTSYITTLLENYAQKKKKNNTEG